MLHQVRSSRSAFEERGEICSVAIVFIESLWSAQEIDRIPVNAKHEADESLQICEPPPIRLVGVPECGRVSMSALVHTVQFTALSARLATSCPWHCWRRDA